MVIRRMAESKVPIVASIWNGQRNCWPKRATRTAKACPYKLAFTRRKRIRDPRLVEMTAKQLARIGVRINPRLD